MSEDKVALLRLCRTEGVGIITFYKLLAKFGSAAAALDFLEREKKMAAFPAAKVENEFRLAEKKGVRMVFSSDGEYPYLLRQIPDRPPVLYVLGNVAALSARSLAVVGSRNASINSRSLASRIAREAVDGGYAVVSGMAIGIDAAAHEGALASKNLEEQRTIAVLAGGVDNIYPASNRGLYARIVEGGAVVSEMPLGTEPMASLFPRRNRIVSGLALGTLVVEASAKSGSLITARLALAQGREVFAVPNFPLDPRAGGTNGLIRNGAILAEGAADVLHALDGLKVGRTDVSEEFYDFVEYGDYDFRGLEEVILSLLSKAPTRVSALLRELAPCAEANVMGALLSLELDGRVAYASGGRVSRIS